MLKAVLLISALFHFLSGFGVLRTLVEYILTVYQHLNDIISKLLEILKFPKVIFSNKFLVQAIVIGLK